MSGAWITARNRVNGYKKSSLSDLILVLSSLWRSARMATFSARLGLEGQLSSGKQRYSSESEKRRFPFLLPSASACLYGGTCHGGLRSSGPGRRSVPSADDLDARRLLTLRPGVRQLQNRVADRARQRRPATRLLVLPGPGLRRQGLWVRHPSRRS